MRELLLSVNNNALCNKDDLGAINAYFEKIYELKKSGDPLRSDYPKEQMKYFEYNGIIKSLISEIKTMCDV